MNMGSIGVLRVRSKVSYGSGSVEGYSHILVIKKRLGRGSNMELTTHTLGIG